MNNRADAIVDPLDSSHHPGHPAPPALRVGSQLRISP